MFITKKKTCNRYPLHAQYNLNCARIYPFFYVKIIINRFPRSSSRAFANLSVLDLLRNNSVFCCHMAE